MNINRLCPNCGAMVDAEDRFCPVCGAAVGEEPAGESVFCEQCGQRNSAGDRFCMACGAPLNAQPAGDPVPAGDPYDDPFDVPAESAKSAPEKKEKKEKKPLFGKKKEKKQEAEPKLRENTFRLDTTVGNHSDRGTIRDDSPSDTLSQDSGEDTFRLEDTMGKHSDRGTIRIDDSFSGTIRIDDDDDAYNPPVHTPKLTREETEKPERPEKSGKDSRAPKKPAKKGNKSGTILGICIALVLLLLAGAVVLFFFGGQDGGQPAQDGMIAPTMSAVPTAETVIAPEVPTAQPTEQIVPIVPTMAPTMVSTAVPTQPPTQAPTLLPVTAVPATAAPTAEPVIAPMVPTTEPAFAPIVATVQPTSASAFAPVITQEPTMMPGAALSDMVVAMESTNLRIGPDETYGVIDIVEKGEQMVFAGNEVTAQNGVVWYYVSRNGVNGWVPASSAQLQRVGQTPTPAPMATAVNAAQQPSGTTVKANTTISLLNGPGAGYSTVSTVPGGSEMPYLGQMMTDGNGASWYKVSYNGAEGWVAVSYTQLN